MVRHRFFIVLFLAICLMLLPSPTYALSANSAVVIDVDSGRILYEKNADVPSRIASLTKIMTCIVAIENGNLDDIITVSENAYGIEGSSIYLQLGEKLKLHDLLYGIMMRSGNDAAIAIAEHVGGSVEGFVELMNQKAQELGLKNTTFINPHGLDEKRGSNFSTAKEMSILTAYALKNPVFAKIVSTKTKSIPYEGQERGRRMHNKNKMLYSYHGADGVKTGYTILARRCLASSATRDGWQLASIVLRAPDWYKDSMAILNIAFDKYQRYIVVEKDEKMTDVPVENGKQSSVSIVAAKKATYPVTQEEKVSLRKEISINPSIKAPISKGEKMGELNIYFQDQLYKTIDLVSAESVEKMNWWDRFKEWLN